MAPEPAVDNRSESWISAWPDALAFVVWLGVAWYSRWTATDLVWSLWLSSLVVGYAMIVWTIVRPGVQIARVVWFARGQVVTSSSGKVFTPPPIVVGGIIAFGALFLLGFFTIHFGGFHYVHSQFLISFFPLEGDGVHRGLAGWSDYSEVLRRYWGFLPAAFIAERGAFLAKLDEGPPDVSVTATAIAARKLANARKPMSGMMAPYRNVVRMHMLIFFFFFAHLAKLENFSVYAVVYTVYFFPWRLVRRSGAPASSAVASA